MLESFSLKGRRLVAAYIAAGVCALNLVILLVGGTFPGDAYLGWALATYFALLTAH